MKHSDGLIAMAILGERHAASRSGGRVLAIANFCLVLLEPNPMVSRAPKPAREPRALPRIALRPAEILRGRVYWRCQGCVTF